MEDPPSHHVFVILQASVVLPETVQGDLFGLLCGCGNRGEKVMMLRAEEPVARVWNGISSGNHHDLFMENFWIRRESQCGISSEHSRIDEDWFSFSFSFSFLGVLGR